MSVRLEHTQSGVGGTAGRAARRRLRALTLALIVLVGLLSTTGAALAQRSARFTVGCWAITSGGGGQRQSLNNRVSDTITFVGGAIQSSQARIRSDHLALLAALQARTAGAPQPPLVNTTVIYLPILQDQSLVLQNICR